METEAQRFKGLAEITVSGRVRSTTQAVWPPEPAGLTALLTLCPFMWSLLLIFPKDDLRTSTSVQVTPSTGLGESHRPLGLTCKRKRTILTNPAAVNLVKQIFLISFIYDHLISWAYISPPHLPHTLYILFSRAHVFARCMVRVRIN